MIKLYLFRSAHFERADRQQCYLNKNNIKIKNLKKENKKFKKLKISYAALREQNKYR